MKGFIFYLEYPTNKDKRAGTRKNPGNHSGNVLAIILNEEKRPYWIAGTMQQECIAAIFSHANSDVCKTSCHVRYLRKNCKRISEAQARTIHPKLFQYLEQ